MIAPKQTATDRLDRTGIDVTPASTLAAALESALDLYIRRDREALARCQLLSGKVIGTDITGLGISLYFLPDERGIQVLSHYEGDVDTRLRGSPLGFTRLSLGSREDALFKGEVEIQGDTEAGQLFQDILAKTDWDWEEQLSRLTGDVVAHQVGKLVRGARAYVDSGRDTLEKDVSEYLQEEARLIPGRFEVEDFLDGVDRLRSDVDRLSARVQRLLTLGGDRDR